MKLYDSSWNSHILECYKNVPKSEKYSTEIIRQKIHLHVLQIINTYGI